MRGQCRITDSSIQNTDRARAFSGYDAHRCPGGVRNGRGTAKAYPASDDTYTMMRIATWNVGSFTGKSRKVVDVMQRRRINALRIQEMKWTGQSAKELGDGYKVFYSGSKDKRNGVGVVLAPEWKAAVADLVRHNDRLMLVKVVQKEVINIISAYAPQSNCSQDEKHLFIEELETLARAVPQTERLVIGADMNWACGSRC